MATNPCKWCRRKFGDGHSPECPSNTPPPPPHVPAYWVPASGGKHGYLEVDLHPAHVGKTQLEVAHLFQELRRGKDQAKDDVV